MVKRLVFHQIWWPAILLAVAVGASLALASCGPSEADRSAPATLGKEYAY